MKQFQQWIRLAVLLVVAVLVCLLPKATPESAEIPSEQFCLYQTDAQGCPYTNDR